MEQLSVLVAPPLTRDPLTLTIGWLGAVPFRPAPRDSAQVRAPPRNPEYFEPEELGRSQVPLGGKHEIDRVAGGINCPVEVCPPRGRGSSAH